MIIFYSGKCEVMSIIKKQPIIRRTPAEERTCAGVTSSLIREAPEAPMDPGMSTSSPMPLLQTTSSFSSSGTEPLQKHAELEIFELSDLGSD